MSNIIEMKSICKSFGAVKALKNIDFAVPGPVKRWHLSAKTAPEKAH